MLKKAGEMASKHKVGDEVLLKEKGHRGIVRFVGVTKVSLERRLAVPKPTSWNIEGVWTHFNNARTAPQTPTNPRSASSTAVLLHSTAPSTISHIPRTIATLCRRAPAVCTGAMDWDRAGRAGGEE